MMLDLESVRLFVLVAEFGNLTRAAEAAGTVQPAVSTRIKSLELALGRKLLERTPRFVRLTPEGSEFLERARTLLNAHDLALAPRDIRSTPLSIGVSDHVLGTVFETMLRRLRAVLPPTTTFVVRLGQSTEVRDLFDAGAIDLAVIRRETAGGDGEVLGEDPLVWYTSAAWKAQWTAQQGSVPLVSLPPPCGVRAVSTKSLDRAGIYWHDAFVGGSCLALVAAVRAGLGVAALGRMLGTGLVDMPDKAALPPLPVSQIVMLARTPSAVEATAARALAASVRETLRQLAA